MNTAATPPDAPPADETMLRVLRDALNLTVIALTQTMPPTQREAFAANLAELAQLAERQGNTLLETALQDLWRNARPR